MEKHINKPDSLDLPSERNLGVMFTLIFAISGAYILWSGKSIYVALVFFLLAILTGGVALIKPKLLAPINLLWFRLGIVLGKIVSPIVLAVIFFIVITPYAFIMKIFGRDPLRLKRLKGADCDTYWIDRNGGHIDPESYKNQF